MSKATGALGRGPRASRTRDREADRDRRGVSVPLTPQEATESLA